MTEAPRTQYDRTSNKKRKVKSAPGTHQIPFHMYVRIVRLAAGVKVTDDIRKMKQIEVKSTQKEESGGGGKAKSNVTDNCA